MDVDRYTADNPFNPLIWEPEKYPIGVDESEERAARVAKARPKLGLSLNKLLGLASDDDERLWHDHINRLVLKSGVWGEWRQEPDARVNIGTRGLSCGQNVTGSTKCSNPAKRPHLHTQFLEIQIKRLILHPGTVCNLEARWCFPRIWYAKKAPKRAQ